HTRGVQLAGGIEEHRQFFQVGGVGGNLNSGNLTEEFTGCIRTWMNRVKDNVRAVSNSEFQPVVSLKLVPLDLLAINKSPMLAALILNEKGAFLGGDDRVVARDAGVGDNQVLFDLAAYGEGTVIQRNKALFFTLNQDERREGAGS